MTNTNNIPKFMTIKQVASTGVLSEYCIRNMVKEGKIPVIFSGKKALINFNVLCEKLNSMTANV